MRIKAAEEITTKTKYISISIGKFQSKTSALRKNILFSARAVLA
jgi:hypothetical protein